MGRIFFVKYKLKIGTLPLNTNEDPQPMHFGEQEIKYVIESLSGRVYKLFSESYSANHKHYFLDINTLVNAITDAATDINRAGSYCSTTGANRFKIASYIANRIAELKPIQVIKGYPENVLSKHLNTNKLNATFAVYCLQMLIGNRVIYPKLKNDLIYCFQFRSRIHADAYAMMLEHALVESPNHFSSIIPKDA